MRAAVCRAFGAPLTIEEVTLAPPRAGEVRVRVAACAICHSDIAYADGAWGGTLPAVYGHEAAGIVEEVGAGVTHLKPGDHAVVTLIRACGHCPTCARGAPVRCETVFPLDTASPLSANGETLVHGLRTAAFAEQVVVEASQAVAIPAEIKLDAAALLACGVLTGVGAVANTAGVRAGESVVVIGTGGVGLNAVQGAALVGATPIIAVDPSHAKRQAALAFGATHAFDAADDGLPAMVRAINGGRLVDWAFVTVGAKAAMEQATGLIGRGGGVVIVGMPPSGVAAGYDPGRLAADEQRILGSKMGSARVPVDIPRLVALYQQGRIKLDALITERYPLERINEAIAAAKRGEALRNVIVFDQ
ncbi:MAG: alcohol dehydrogenase catalytic domain-containing protein [Alphaproteobacteria bacterium]|nr:alcohol dehydrogenase catalytic domain-containing protein [Alphaproteobacteria bacterium]